MSIHFTVKIGVVNPVHIQYLHLALFFKSNFSNFTEQTEVLHIWLEFYIH